ncbi:MAG TPA: hypothetical protein VMG10_19450 [Gemmataceae bacterium]|nr:hypothetical protein [Gemmataceae bacterium]
MLSKRRLDLLDAIAETNFDLAVLDGLSEKALAAILRALRPDDTRFDERPADDYRALSRYLEWAKRLPHRASGRLW